MKKYEGRSRSNRTFAIIIVHVYISKNNVHEMKDGSLIDKSVKFQINRSMDIKFAQHLVRLVKGGRARCNVILTLSCKIYRCSIKTNQKQSDSFHISPLYLVYLYLSCVCVLLLIKLKNNETLKCSDLIYN